MTDLITIDELIAQTGCTRIHVAYLTKLGILPGAVKRKINGKLVGCYPKDSLNKLLEVKNMKGTGITYSQLAKNPVHQMLQPIPHDTAFTIQVKPSNFAYLVLGLVIGVLVSTLNTSGLAAMNTKNLPLKSDVYLIGIDKSNLDKLDKTNINYLIKN